VDLVLPRSTVDRGGGRLTAFNPNVEAMCPRCRGENRAPRLGSDRHRPQRPGPGLPTGRPRCPASVARSRASPASSSRHPRWQRLARLRSGHQRGQLHPGRRRGAAEHGSAPSTL